MLSNAVYNFQKLRTIFEDKWKTHEILHGSNTSFTGDTALYQTRYYGADGTRVFRDLGKEAEPAEAPEINVALGDNHTVS